METLQTLEGEKDHMESERRAEPEDVMLLQSDLEELEAMQDEVDCSEWELQTAVELGVAHARE